MLNEPNPLGFNSPSMITPINITPKAESEIKNIMTNKNIPADYHLRVGVKGGGCGGMSYSLGFDKPKPDDQHFEIDGIQVLIEKRHYMFLMGMLIDFFEGDEARGFTFINPDLPKRHDQG
jgi:iron-sulfur cluster assembly protein